MFKLHKSTEYVTSEDSYVIKNIIIEKQNCELRQKKVVKSPQEILDETQEEADKLIREAKEEAEQIILNARREAHEMAENIKKEAFDEGFLEGKNQGFEEVKTTIMEAKDVLEEMIQEKYKLISDLEPEIIKLCVKIADKIIGQQIELDNKKFVSLISKAIKNASGAEAISVYINPKYYDKIIELKELLMDEAHKIKNIEIFKSEFMDELDCLIETDCGVIDAGVKAQIENVEQIFDINKLLVSK